VTRTGPNKPRSVVTTYKLNYEQETSPQKEQVKRAETETVLRQERRFGKFNRIFTLPDNIQEEGILAKFENGVLNITLPKTEKSQSRKVTISETADPTLMKN
jgi:HSP20 family protein